MYLSKLWNVFLPSCETACPHMFEMYLSTLWNVFPLSCDTECPHMNLLTSHALSLHCLQPLRHGKGQTCVRACEWPKIAKAGLSSVIEIYIADERQRGKNWHYLVEEDPGLVCFFISIFVNLFVAFVFVFHLLNWFVCILYIVEKGSSWWFGRTGFPDNSEDDSLDNASCEIAPIVSDVPMKIWYWVKEKLCGWVFTF